MIFDQFPDSLVSVWAINQDAEFDWLNPYRQQYNLHLPIMHHADVAFERFHLGRAWSTFAPLYIIIDKRGVIRHRSFRQGSIRLERVAEMVQELVNE